MVTITAFARPGGSIVSRLVLRRAPNADIDTGSPISERTSVASQRTRSRGSVNRTIENAAVTLRDGGYEIRPCFFSNNGDCCELLGFGIAGLDATSSSSTSGSYFIVVRQRRHSQYRSQLPLLACRGRAANQCAPLLVSPSDYQWLCEYHCGCLQRWRFHLSLIIAILDLGLEMIVVDASQGHGIEHCPFSVAVLDRERVRPMIYGRRNADPDCAAVSTGRVPSVTLTTSAFPSRMICNSTSRPADCPAPASQVALVRILLGRRNGRSHRRA